MHKKTKPTYLAILLASIALVGAGVFLFDKHTSEADEVSPTEEEAFTVSADSTSVAEVTQIDVPVRGLVQPAQYVDVRARVSGEVTELPITEGSRVSAGSLLFRQAQPVVNAEGRLVQVRGEQEEVETALVREQEIFRLAQTEIEERTSGELAVLREKVSETSVRTERQSLELAVDGMILGLVKALDFINQERTYFDQEQQQQYQAVVQELYGGLPNFLVGPLRYTVDQPADLIRLLEEQELSAQELAGLATLLDVQTAALLQVLVAAEPELFAADGTARTDSVLETYLGARESIVTARQTLQRAEGQLWDAVLGGEEAVVAAERDVAATATDRERQQQLVAWRTLLADIAIEAATAELGVVQAQQAEGQVVAPWESTVAEVLVEPGEYVQVGQTVIRLYSEEAREVRVTVPANSAFEITPGTLVYQTDRVVGMVDRVVNDPGTGQVVVYIAVADTSIPLGSVLRGELRLPVPDGQQLVNRSRVSFGTNGPYIQTDQDTQVVEILRDLGDQYLVRPLR